MFNESWLKAEIISRGIVFSQEALDYANVVGAKGQNLCYNAPKNFQKIRPQELRLTGCDGYCTVVSCVAPTGNCSAFILEVVNDCLVLMSEHNIIDYVDISYVCEPSYYNATTSNGWPVHSLVSACGADELNILPWRGCMLEKGCLFCGVNAVTTSNMTLMPSAYTLSKDHNSWDSFKGAYLENLQEAVSIALTDPCYRTHVHPIIISGNLACLDQQADIYAEIAGTLMPLLAAEHIDPLVAVMTPPQDLGRLDTLHTAGIGVVVFNREVGTEPYFSSFCPGKAALGHDFFNYRLSASLPIFGVGNVWCNFVFGLEPYDALLKICSDLAASGIVPGANVYHLDHGNSMTHAVPKREEIIYFFCRLAEIYKAHDMRPFYCAEALRTSLANEAWAGRFSSIVI